MLRIATLDLILVISAPALFSSRAAQSSLAGRWDLTVQGTDSVYPSWLEVTAGAGGQLTGRFVGHFGSVRPITKLEFSSGNLMFSLPPQFVGYHRWLARYRGYHRYADTPTLNCLHKRAEISVAGEKNHLVDLIGQIHGIHGQFDVNASFELAAAALVRELFHGLQDDNVAIVIEPICQRADRRIFLIFNNSRVVECA